MNPNPNPAAHLPHLSALHLLGRILERRDQQHHMAPGPSRYQTAMQRLAQALDRVEHAVELRQVLDMYSGVRR